VAGVAILRDGLRGLALVLVVVAAEAAREVGVADVVGIQPPCDSHRREDVSAIDGKQSLAGAIDFDPSVPEYSWAVLGPVPGFRISRDYGKTWQDISKGIPVGPVNVIRLIQMMNRLGAITISESGFRVAE
jgi:hypothetical protein